MVIAKVTITQYTCNQCGHSWQKRRENTPRMCPRCKAVTWDDPPRHRKEKP